MAAYQSLYRRYRPQRFDEVLGQDHVTKALRNAVRDGRVGHAYLFSGPRGTGKTSTARILAKVLNCAAPVDGEPCCKCDNCVAVAEGRIVDWLLEQDAASKSKVDDMRDLLERVPLGTSGTRKVIILDEVHMLSQGAENALLKTLEEPPGHVVFVLATTDPQKVRPTVRSRTQHFEFRLLPPDVLADHVRHVIADAGLALDQAAVDQAIDHVLRSGGGSARDTLSALDQVAALGEVVDDDQPVDAVLDALAGRDPGRVLVAVADALASGRDPRTLGEALIVALRDAFLAVMGAAVDHLAPDERERAAGIGERLGPGGLTRALDVLGEALVELSRKPDPRIVVEVALVRLTQPATDRSVDAILDRLERLERAAGRGSGGQSGPGPSGGPPPAEGDAAPTAEVPTTAGGGDRSDGGAGAATARAALSDRRGERTPGGRAAPRGAAAPGADPASRGADDAGLAGADVNSSADSTPSTSSTVAAAKPTLGSVVRGRTRQPRDDRPGTAPGTATGTATAAVTDTGAAAGASDRPGATATGTAAATGTATAAVTDTGAAAGASDRPGAAATPSGPAERLDPAPSADRAADDTAVDASRRVPDRSQIIAAWSDAVLAALPPRVRSRWRGGQWIDPDASIARFAVPNEWHQRACDESRPEVERALATHFGSPVSVAVVIEGGAETAGDPGRSVVPTGAGPAAPAGASSADHELEHIDPAELRDADDAPTNGVDLVVRAFGGGELVEEDP
jgi:DNA polymerase-3 subunit gamma/tau